jgi:tetratricopeptide (TPR) repeat protein
MVVYIFAVIVIAAVISIFFGALLNKNKLLGLHAIFAITLGSMVISVAMPFIIGRFIDISQNGQVIIGNVVLAVAVSLAVYSMTLLLSTVTISSFFSGIKSETSEENAKSFIKSKFMQRKQDLHMEQQERSILEDMISEGSILKAFGEDNPEQTEKQIGLAPSQDENIFEKSVDSEQIIDKMGVETIDKIGDAVEDTDSADIKDLYLGYSFDEYGNYVINPDESGTADNLGFSTANKETQYINEEKNADNISNDSQNVSLTIEDYINKAFEYKTKGNLEEAILNYMYALDKDPEKELVFWIILDICVLYKSLGQVELAAEILEGYISNYGELMDDSLKMEIERNLA